MAVKINNNSYSGFFLNGEAINTIYLNGNQVFGNGGSEPTPTPAWDADFLTIEALNPSTTVTLKNPSNKNIWYRKDNETEYTKIPIGDTSITIENAKGYIKLYGDNEGVGAGANRNAFNIYCQMNCNCYGKVTSLLSSGCPQTISSTYAFGCLFYQSSIVDARGLILPNNVSNNCYYRMFFGCSSLVTPPVLPSTALAFRCYGYMFGKCKALTTAPQLLSTTLEDNCYERMFDSCKSLVNPPSLPATTLTDYCYSNMFWGCSSLVTPPVLPSTTLTTGCYQGMFNGCTKLTTAPDLLSTTLEDNCYFYMFTGCKALMSLRVGFSTISGINPLKNWLDNITTTGVLYAPSGATYSASDIGLPSTWTLSKTLSPSN